MQPKKRGINPLEKTYNPFCCPISPEDIAINKCPFGRRFYTTNGRDCRKYQRRDYKHLERREVEGPMTMQTVANHVPWSPKQLMNGTQHRPRTEAPDIKEALHHVFESHALIGGT